MSTWKSTDEVVAKKRTRVAIVAAEFNKEYVDTLLENTKKGLLDCGVKEKKIDIVRVPGSFELPFACKKMAQSRKYDAIIALGVIIRGKTIHFELVSNEAARGITELNLLLNTPIIFGVLACDTKKQVTDRLPLGEDFAKSAIKMMGDLKT